MSLHTPTANEDNTLRGFVQRHSTLLGAGAAALVAVILLVVALGSGGDSKSSPSVGASSVVVAKRTIHRGTLLDSRTAAGSLTIRRVGSDDVQTTAVTSLAAVHGKVAAAEIRPGEQVTTSDLSGDRSALVSQLTGAARAVTLPVDGAHGMVGDIAIGDHVDVYASIDNDRSNGASTPVLKMIAQDVEVLRAPTAVDGSSDNDAKATAQITLDMSSKEAQFAAFAADNGKVWVAARPASGSGSTNAATVTAQSLLAKGN